MKTISKITFLLLLIVTTACEDILEKDITNSAVQINYPLANTNIYSNAVNFQWSKLDGATKYRIQVITPSTAVVIDSTVTTNNLNIPLTEGSYQWRVRAENNAYTSTYTNNTAFTISQTSDLTAQQIILSSPTDNYYTNNTNTIVSWQNLNAATAYNFELVNVTNNNAIVNQQSNLTATSITLNSSILATDAQYQWKVKGLNNISQTAFASRNIYLDRVTPNQPTNSLPTNNSTQTINQLITFSWSSTPDSGTIQSPITYQIEIANDSNFTSIIQTATTSNTSLQRSFSATSDYYWRVKAIDQAGNNSITSSAFKFTIN